MKATFASRVNLWLMRTIYVQLYLSLISCPILIYWGLPVSLASPLGNILFNPLLTIFLFFSSLLFFTELLCIPNSCLATMLNHCTALFDYGSRLGSQGWLLGFAKPSVLLLLLIPLCTLLVIHYRFNRKRWRGVISLILLSGAISISLMQLNHPQTVQTIPCNNGSLSLICMQSCTMLIDPGYLGSRISAPSYIQYTLVPAIIKNAGTMTIDKLLLLKFNLTTLSAVNTLCQLLTIHTIYLPELHGTMSEREEKEWNQFKKNAADHGAIIVPISGPFSIKFEKGKTIVAPYKKQLHYNDIFYNAMSAKTTIDNREYSWHSR